VPEELIHYRETKNFNPGFEKPAALTISDDQIYLVGDKMLKQIDRSGQLIREIPFNAEPSTVEVNADRIYVAFKNRIRIYDKSGEFIDEWSLDSENSLITAIGTSEDNVFVADAGNRRILRFSLAGDLLGEFQGKASADDLHGFIIPSPYFDMDITEYDDLWVVNPGLHTLEQYTEDGNLREHWRSSGARTEGFSGCCNPAHFCFLSDGSFVTSEKGLVRIKVYKPSGEFFCVVAAPTKFEDKIEGQAPDVDADSEGNIYALDFDRKLLRVFEKK